VVVYYVHGDFRIFFLQSVLYLFHCYPLVRACVCVTNRVCGACMCEYVVGMCERRVLSDARAQW